jgi:hypothetical protein
VLSEPITWNLFAGTVLVLAGIALSNRAPPCPPPTPSLASNRVMPGGIDLAHPRSRRATASDRRATASDRRVLSEAGRLPWSVDEPREANHARPVGCCAEGRSGPVGNFPAPKRGVALVTARSASLSVCRR